MNQHDWRNLFINVARRERSSSITAVHFSASPLPGSTRLTTASALICPSWTRKSRLTGQPKPLGVGVSTNRPPKLMFRTREMSSCPAQRQSTHTPSGVLTREVNLLEGEADCFNICSPRPAACAEMSEYRHTQDFTGGNHCEQQVLGSRGRRSW